MGNNIRLLRRVLGHLQSKHMLKRNQIVTRSRNGKTPKHIFNLQTSSFTQTGIMSRQAQITWVAHHERASSMVQNNQWYVNWTDLFEACKQVVISDPPSRIIYVPQVYRTIEYIKINQRSAFLNTVARVASAAYVWDYGPAYHTQTPDCFTVSPQMVCLRNVVRSWLCREPGTFDEVSSSRMKLTRSVQKYAGCWNCATRVGFRRIRLVSLGSYRSAD